MPKEIVMLHGANAGGWCFAKFKTVFEDLGWTCHTPDLVGHGADAANSEAKLASKSVKDYYAQLDKFLRKFDTPPVVLGHSLGAILAQQLASRGLARSLVLISPAAHASILVATDNERKMAQDFMSLGPFWTRVLPPDFEIAAACSLNRIPREEQRQIFDKFSPESGRVWFELFFWMFDLSEATAVDAAAIDCPVLCISGTDDQLVSIPTARRTAESLKNAIFEEAKGHAHMLPMEPGAEEIARRIADWVSASVRTPSAETVE